MEKAPSGDLSERQALLALNALPGIGPITLNRLLGACGGDPRAVLAGGARTLEAAREARPAVRAALEDWRAHFDVAREEDRLAKSGADFLIPADPAYAEPLRHIHDPPIGLYRKGPYGFDRPGVAIVGTRNPSVYGRETARRLAAGLARCGFAVVSGLARGIDAAAHEGALEAGGRTVAVLGSGLDVVYPPENLDLYRRIAESGAVLSEFCFGRRPDRTSFVRRNRIVSGLSAAVVVVESAADGGAMITARFAGEQGRLVLAVPGRIDQPTSAGCHQLIRDGATLVARLEDILEELRYPGAPLPEPATASAPPELDPDEGKVRACFAGGAILAPDALAAQAGLSAARIAAALLSLELKGMVAKRIDGAYEAIG